MTEWETIAYLIDTGKSIARYGDGELKLCVGRSAKSQKADPEMAKRLKDILKSKDKRCLIGIPRIYSPEDSIRMSERKWSFWYKYATKRFRILYDGNKQYGSAFITRPDTNADIDCEEYYEEVKSIWRGRDILVVHGEGTGFLKKQSLVKDVRSCRVLVGPIVHAFSYHGKLLKTILGCSSSDMVILLSLGPEATVLAYDLAVNGRQALDLGHMGMFYAHVHPKDSKWDGVYLETY